MAAKNTTAPDQGSIPIAEEIAPANDRKYPRSAFIRSAKGIDADILTLKLKAEQSYTKAEVEKILKDFKGKPSSPNKKEGEK